MRAARQKSRKRGRAETRLPAPEAQPGRLAQQPEGIQIVQALFAILRVRRSHVHHLVEPGPDHTETCVPRKRPLLFGESEFPSLDVTELTLAAGEDGRVR